MKRDIRSLRSQDGPTINENDVSNEICQNEDKKMYERAKVTKNNERYKSVPEFVTTIRALYLSMNFLGLWPRTVSHRRYNFLWYVQSVGLLFQLFGPAGGLVVQRNDFQKIIDNLGLVIPMTTICLKWVTFRVRGKTIERLFDSMKEDWINLKKNNTLIIRNVPDSRKIMTTYSRSARMFFFIYVIMMGLAIVNLISNSIVARKSGSTNFDNLLPIPNSWYPVNYNESSNVQILSVIQTYTMTTIALANGCVDSVFVALSLHICGQLEILGHFMRSINCDSSRLESCKNEIRLTVKRHQQLLRAAEGVQKAYSLIILEQLIASTLTTCFLGYKIIVTLEKNEADKNVLLGTILLYGVTLQTIFSYCLIGDYLRTASLEIAIAAYDAPWYNSPRSIRILFIIVMMRAARSLQINGANLLPMSLDSFAVIMKTAVSYLSVLRAMSADN